MYSAVFCGDTLQFLVPRSSMPSLDLGSEGPGRAFLFLPSFFPPAHSPAWCWYDLTFFFPGSFLTCQDVPQADAPWAIHCPVGDLNHVQNGKAHADQSQGQGQEEKQQNCHVEACVEFLHQVWEDWGEKTQKVLQPQRLANSPKALTCSLGGSGRTGLRTRKQEMGFQTPEDILR